MNCDKWGWGEPTFSLLDWYLSSGICCSTQVSVLSVEMVGPAGHTSKKKANIRVLWFYFSFSLKEKKWKERTNKYKIVHSQWWIWILMIHQKKISVIDNLIALMLSACLCCPDRCCQQSMCDYRWTLDRWPVLHMHPARPCSASCRGWRPKAEGITLTVTVSSTRYLSSRFRPSTSGPDLCTGSGLGPEIYRILCWQEGLSLLLSKVIVGNHNFQWNTIVPECRMRGNMRLVPAAYTV